MDKHDADQLEQPNHRTGADDIGLSVDALIASVTEPDVDRAIRIATHLLDSDAIRHPTYCRAWVAEAVRACKPH